MKIGVSGASGRLGKAAVAELLARGGSNEIFGISRTPESVEAPAVGRRGDYNLPESLDAAYGGLDRLVLIPSANAQSGLRDRQFVTAIDAAVEAGVEHIVMISSVATSDLPEKDMFAAYWTGEQHLMRTAPSWTILRMNYFSETFAQAAKTALETGTLKSLGTSRVGFVSRDDLAGAVAGILLGDGHAGKIYNATGPDVVSGEERAAMIAEIGGCPVRYLVTDEASLRARLLGGGLPEPLVNSLVDIERHFMAGDFDIVTGDVERLAGCAPRSLEAVLRQMLREA